MCYDYDGVSVFMSIYDLAGRYYGMSNWSFSKFSTILSSGLANVHTVIVRRSFLFQFILVDDEDGPVR